MTVILRLCEMKGKPISEEFCRRLNAVNVVAVLVDEGEMQIWHFLEKLVVLNNVHALSFDGSGTLLSLEFTTVAPGTSVIELQNAAAFDSTGAQADISFFGGSVTVPASAR